MICMVLAGEWMESVCGYCARLDYRVQRLVPAGAAGEAGRVEIDAYTL